MAVNAAYGTCRSRLEPSTVSSIFGNDWTGSCGAIRDRCVSMVERPTAAFKGVAKAQIDIKT